MPPNVSRSFCALPYAIVGLLVVNQSHVVRHRHDTRRYGPAADGACGDCVTMSLVNSWDRPGPVVPKPSP